MCHRRAGNLLQRSLPSIPDANSNLGLARTATDARSQQATVRAELNLANWCFVGLDCVSLNGACPLRLPSL